MNEAERKALEKTVRQAHELRQRLYDAPRSNDPVALHAYLRLCRDVTDKLEDMLGSLILLRARTDQAVATRRGEIEDAEVKAKIVHDEYSSGRERSVSLNAATIEERLKLRRAEAVQRAVRASQEYVALLHRGADQSRRDADTRLRAVALETSLERGG